MNSTSNVTFLSAIHKNENIPFSVIGIVDGEDDIELFIPKHFFSENEKNDLLDNKTNFCSSFWSDNSDNVYVQTPAYNATCDLTNFSITIQHKDVSFSDLITDMNTIIDKAHIHALAAYNTVTGEILFIEGTDEDGYNLHSLTLADSIDINDALVKNASFETNARKLTGVFDDITVSIVRILI